MAQDDKKQPAQQPAQKPAQKSTQQPPDKAAQSAQQPAQKPDSNDPAIAQIQQKIRSNTPPNLRVAVQKIVIAGMKLMYSPQTHQLMLDDLQKQSLDPGTAVGKGVASLITILYRQSNNTMPIPAIPLAAVLLVCEALDFMEKSKMAQITPQVIDTATQTVVAMLMQKVGLTPQKMAEIAANGRAQQAGGQPPQQPAQPAPQPPQAPSGLIQGAQQ